MPLRRNNPEKWRRRRGEEHLWWEEAVRLERVFRGFGHLSRKLDHMVSVSDFQPWCGLDCLRVKETSIKRYLECTNEWAYGEWISLAHRVLLRHFGHMPRLVEWRKSLMTALWNESGNSRAPCQRWRRLRAIAAMT